MSKEVRIRGNVHLRMDGDRNKDPHWSTGLSPEVQMRSRRRENTNKEVRTERDVFTH